MTPERELLREARDELRWCSGSPDFNEGGQARKGWIKGPQAVLNKIDAFFAQPESTQQAVPAGCVECMQEASEVLSEERMPRGPLADELWGFSLMLRDNAAQATQQAVLGAYTRCAEICNVKSHRIYDEYGSTDQETGERTIPMRFMDTVEACDDCAEAILAARDELKDKI